MNMILLIFLGILSRLIPHPPNMTAVGGLAVFSGARLERKKAIFVMFGTMLISDMVLGFHPVMWATYGSLALGVLLGTLLKRSHSFGRIITVTFVSSFIFYLITNFAVWTVPGSMYPKTLSGLLQSYVMALPFFRNSLIGDIGYSLIFFKAYELVRNYKQLFMKFYVRNS